MKADFIGKYNSSNEDEKMEILINITEKINDTIYQFLFSELNNEDDEFVLIEIIKVLSLYSPTEYNDELVRKFFKIIKDSDDDLVQAHTMQGLEHLKLSSEDYKIIKEIIDKTDSEDLAAGGRMLLLKHK